MLASVRTLSTPVIKPAKPVSVHFGGEKDKIPSDTKAKLAKKGVTIGASGGAFTTLMEFWGVERTVALLESGITNPYVLGVLIGMGVVKKVITNNKK